MGDEGYPFFVDFYFPCIVFDGDMFEAIVENGKISLQETDHIVLSTSIPSKKNQFYMKYLIDVVRKDFFKDYLKIIEIDLQNFLNEIKNNCEKAINIIGAAGAKTQREWEDKQKANEKSTSAEKPVTEEKSKSGSFDPESLDWELRA